MSKNLAFLLAIPALALAANAAETANYCPPGAKFCPAPGTDNTVFLDTHFGMDAATGQVVAYTGTAHPDEVNNGPGTVTEQVLFSSPPISVENRFVPYPGAPQPNMDATTVYVAQAAPVPTPAQPVVQAYGQPIYGQQPQYRQPASQQPRPAPRVVQAESEVANQQTARGARKEETITNGDKVPWWKGGLWRNRGRDDEDDAPPPRRSASTTTNTASRAAANDDMWDDEEFTGYNPDGSVARQAPAPYAAPQYGAPQAQVQQQQYADPYATQTYPATPLAGGYVGDAYTLPNSPPPTSPYQPGYVYPGTDISYESTQQGGFQGYYQDPNVASAPAMVVSAPTPYPTESASPFMPTAPQAPASYQSAPAVDAGGSPQFENAVRMVKDNRFSEAKSLLASETSRNPGNAAAWRWLADCHYNLLELDEAIAAYQRAIDRDPNDYYAQRGLGFSYLHRGHEFWRRMQEEVASGQKETAAATFAQAHENYKKSLEVLGLCLRRAPNDGEAIYGEAMAAEGASRKLYSNAISYLKLGPDQRERAELFAENCLTVINKGVERARDRARSNPGDAGPRALLGGLYLRKAILYHQLGKNDLAMLELRNSRDVQQAILDDIDKNNATAQKNLKECQAYWDAWGGGNQ